MNLKYFETIKDIPNCPPANRKNIEIESYRFVFNDINHKNNFLPVLKIKPKRINTKRFSRDRDKCSGYAISLYNTLENAINKYVKLKNNMRNIDKVIGNHIAFGLIDKSDGFVTEANKEGHFDLHEFDDVILKDKFRIICGMFGV